MASHNAYIVRIASANRLLWRAERCVTITISSATAEIARDAG